MTLVLNEKVKVKFWFDWIEGTVTKINKGLYTIEAGGKSFQFYKNELKGKVSK